MASVLGRAKRFSFGVNIFDPRASLPEIFTQAFSEWARTGLGPRRGRVELLGPVNEGAELNLDLTGASGDVEMLVVVSHSHGAERESVP